MGGLFKPWLPDWIALDVPELILSLVAVIALLRLHLGIPKTLALCGALGLMWKLAV
jgi:hypothetical protein